MYVIQYLQALAMQEELERKKARDYRLRAFTGDDLPYY